MPQTPHVEKHFTASETVRDIVIGMLDRSLRSPLSPIDDSHALARSFVVSLARNTSSGQYVNRRGSHPG